METTVLAVSDFLLARITEDEAVARHSGRVDWLNGGAFNPSRVLAECEAKRRVVEPWRYFAVDPVARSGDEDDWRYGVYAAAHGVVLRAMAAVYAEHPDYRQEWAPTA